MGSAEARAASPAPPPPRPRPERPSSRAGGAAPGCGSSPAAARPGGAGLRAAGRGALLLAGAARWAPGGPRPPSRPFSLPGPGLGALSSSGLRLSARGRSPASGWASRSPRGLRPRSLRLAPGARRLRGALGRLSARRLGRRPAAPLLPSRPRALSLPAPGPRRPRALRLRPGRVVFLPRLQPWPGPLCRARLRHERRARVSGHPPSPTPGWAPPSLQVFSRCLCLSLSSFSPRFLLSLGVSVCLSSTTASLALRLCLPGFLFGPPSLGVSHLSLFVPLCLCLSCLPQVSSDLASLCLCQSRIFVVSVARVPSRSAVSVGVSRSRLCPLPVSPRLCLCPPRLCRIPTTPRPHSARVHRRLPRGRTHLVFSESGFCSQTNECGSKRIESEGPGWGAAGGCVGGTPGGGGARWDWVRKAGAGCSGRPNGRPALGAVMGRGPGP